VQKLAHAGYSPLQEMGGLHYNSHPFVALAGVVLVSRGHKTL